MSKIRAKDVPALARSHQALATQNAELRAKLAAQAAPPAAPPPAAPPPDPRTVLAGQIAGIEQRANEAIARGHGRFQEHKRNTLIAAIAKSENARTLFKDDNSAPGK